MTVRTITKRPCVHCDPNTPPGRSIVEPILTLTRTEAFRVAGSRAETTPLALQFRCKMCSRTWGHRVDVKLLGPNRR